MGSGATWHMVIYKDIFSSYSKFNNNDDVMTINRDSLLIEGCGQITLMSDIGDKLFNLRDVLYVSGLKFNLLSSKQITEMGIEIYFNSENAMLQ